jgi:hypothetical protein
MELYTNIVDDSNYAFWASRNRSDIKLHLRRWNPKRQTSKTEMPAKLIILDNFSYAWVGKQVLTVHPMEVTAALHCDVKCQTEVPLTAENDCLKLERMTMMINSSFHFLAFFWRHTVAFTDITMSWPLFLFKRHAVLSNNSQILPSEDCNARFFQHPTWISWTVTWKCWPPRDLSIKVTSHWF